MQEPNSIVTTYYDSIAPIYERVIVPVYRPMAKRLLQMIDLRPGWKVLDAGTGTGLVALLGAARVGKGGRMVGIDASEKMLEIARAKAAQFGFTQCEFRVGDLQALDRPSDAFDAALSHFALHYVDPVRAMAEIRRVLAPGGRLVLLERIDSEDNPGQVMFQVLDKYKSAAANETLSAWRAHSAQTAERRSRWSSETALADLARTAGFSDVKTVEERLTGHLPSAEAFVEFASVGPTLRAELDALSESDRSAYLGEARQAVKTYETSNGFEWGLHVIELIASK